MTSHTAYVDDFSKCLCIVPNVILYALVRSLTLQRARYLPIVLMYITHMFPLRMAYRVVPAIFYIEKTISFNAKEHIVCIHILMLFQNKLYPVLRRSELPVCEV